MNNKSEYKYSRGYISPDFYNSIAKKHGIEVPGIENKTECQSEIRLLPYLMVCLFDDQLMYRDSSRIDNVEKEIINKWIDKGYLARSDGRVRLNSPNFYNFISEVNYHSYVNLSLINQPKECVNEDSSNE